MIEKLHLKENGITKKSDSHWETTCCKKRHHTKTLKRQSFGMRQLLLKQHLDYEFMNRKAKSKEFDVGNVKRYY